MTSGILPEEKRNLERQMGCMAGFFQLFDRHQILAGKRIYSTRRLPSSPGTSSSPSPSERSDFSPPPPPFRKDLVVQTLKKNSSTPPPVAVVEEAVKNVVTPSRSSAALPLPVLEFKEGSKTSWKLREAPRLSLDSRLLNEKGRLEIRTTHVPSDGSDDQRRSPSVVARLMGLELFPKSESGDDCGTVHNVVGAVQLKRSASESRASKEFLHHSFFHEKSYQERRAPAKPDPKPKVLAKQKPAPPMLNRSGGGGGSVQMRKSSFDAQDFFPEPSKRIGNVNGNNFYSEIEKKLWMAKDLDSLKQILEALQLKGLLHARSSPLPHHNQIPGRNLIFERQQPSPRSPIVLMKPASTIKSPSRFGTTSSSPVRNSGRRDRAAEIGEKKVRNYSNGRIPPDPPTSPSSAARRKRYSLQVQSPRSSGSSPRRPLLPSSEHTTNMSPRNRKAAPSIERFSDASSTISDASSYNNHFEVEKVKVEDFHEGRNLLKRCDKLLQSIAEITSPAPTQPSPVSVLDSVASFRSDGGDERSPLSRHIEFGDGAELMALEVDDASWTPLPSVPITIQNYKQPELIPVDDVEATDQDFAYVADIFRSFSTTAVEASTPQPDVYFFLEKQYEEEDYPYSSSSSSSHRRVIFDTVTEIVERKNQHLISSPWTAFARSRSVTNVESTRSQARETWTELKRLLDPVSATDLCELVCGVLKKDLSSCCNEAQQQDWSDRSFEMSDAVLDIERLIFKDLVVDTIRDLAVKFRRFTTTSTTKSNAAVVSRRKLLF